MATVTVSEARLLVSVPLLYRPARLIHFFDQLRCLKELDAAFLRFDIVTSTFDDSDLEVIRRLAAPFVAKNFQVAIRSYWNPSDPKSMTWVHKASIRDMFLGGDAFTHFIYLEDDIRLSRENVKYFLEDRAPLGALGFIPSFIRYEFNTSDSKLYASDVVRGTSLRDRVIFVGDRRYVMADNPYCASYILDRALAEEYVDTPSFDQVRSLETWAWPSTERSAMGLCFENVPAGHLSRFKVPLMADADIPDPKCWIHHLPNNFTHSDWPEGHTPFGKTEMLAMFTPDRGEGSP